MADRDSAAFLRDEINAIVRDHLLIGGELGGAISSELLAAILKRWGGRMVYVPVLDRTARNRDIAREFNGRNIAEIKRRYRLSKSQIYAIVGRRQS